jgi:hypothetical protein
MEEACCGCQHGQQRCRAPGCSTPDYSARMKGNDNSASDHWGGGGG